MESAETEVESFVQLEWGEKPFPYLGPQRALRYHISGSCRAHTRLYFLIARFPYSAHRPVIWTRLQPVGCVPFLAQHLPPHSTRFLQLAKPEAVGACRSPRMALSCPKPGVDLCGVGKQESQSILWDKGVETEAGKRSIEGMGNRGGTSQGTRLCQGSCHRGGGFPPLC